ncbi:MAG TPA: hypothetical protein VNA17_00135 [Pyrinomonadaceae bacterium]|nr:hypothetical protein [Pyrinomonadaceae bacterium]
MRKHVDAICGVILLVIIVLGCSGGFTTANISKFEVGKNDTAEPRVTTFDAGEKAFAVATVSNTSQKHKMAFKVTFENVEGQSKGTEILSNSIDFEGSRPVWYGFTLPLPGEYTVEASLLDDAGKTIDTESTVITIRPTAGTNSPDENSDG